MKTDRGITQPERFPPALAPQGAGLDERSLAVLLAMAPEYARMLNYYNADADPDGDWAPFFEGELTFLLAQVCTWSPLANSTILQQPWPPDRVELGSGDWSLMQQIFGAAVGINQWFERFAAREDGDLHQPEAPFFTTLNNTIKNELKPALQAMMTIPAQAQAWRALEQSTWPVTIFAPIWGLPGPSGDQHDANCPATDDTTGEPAETRAAAGNLPPINANFLDAVSKLKQSARGYLKLSMQQQDHLPHTTLYMAFLKIFRLAQIDMNRFTERHLEYYYQTILRLYPAPGQSDMAVAVVTLASTCAALELPRGTQMTAGSNALGNHILYANTAAVWLNQINIASLRALYMGSTGEPTLQTRLSDTSDTGTPGAGGAAATDSANTTGLNTAPGAAPGSALDTAVVDYIFAAPVADSLNGLGLPLKYPAKGWPTFGPEKPLDPVDVTALNANLGLVISSPVLLLQEGVRCVKVAFNFSHAALMQTQTTSYMNAVAVNSGGGIGTSASTDTCPCPNPCDDGSAPTNDPTLDLSDAFLLYMSTSAGWLQISDFALTCPAADLDTTSAASDASSWTLRFVLQTDAVALVSYQAADIPINSPWPMLKLVINPDATVYCYSYFRPLTIDSLDIQVSVCGLQSLTLETVGGAVTTGKPFLPFGSLPTTGASFQVAQQELSAKQVTRATLNLTWQALPSGPDGVISFAEYYAGYSPYAFANDIFKVNLYVYSGGAWVQQTPPAKTASADAESATGSSTADANANNASATANSDKEYDLFAEDGDQNLLPKTIFDFDMTALAWSYQSYLESMANPASNPTLPGTLSVEFADPLYGFGNAVYPNVFAQAAIDNTRIIEATPLPTTTASDSTATVTTTVDDVTITETIQTVSSTTNSTTPTPTPTPTATATPTPATSLPNAPFSPTIKTLTVDYCAVDTIHPVAVNDVVPTGRLPQFYQLYPFGFALPQEVPATLFPVAPGRGQLYIGLAKVTPPQSLNLYFRFCEKAASQYDLPASNDSRRPDGGDSGDDGDDSEASSRNMDGDESSDLSRQDNSPTIFWRYLSNNQWKDFADHTVVSWTGNFSTSGLVVLQLPQDINGDNTVMPTLADDGTFWIEAYTKLDPAGFSNTVAILPQAVEVWRVNPADIEVLPLPAGSITALAQPLAEVKSIDQPYPSEGGQAKESLLQYQARVSARLRHKQRAVLLADYELLVLEAFPVVWQAKCIGPNNSRGYGDENRVAAGNIVLALSPAIEAWPQSGTPLPMSTLELVAHHLQALASPLIRQITVRNLSYERLKVFFKVLFKSNHQTSVGIAQLNQTIIEFLQPWQSEALPYLDIGIGSIAVLDIARLIRKQAFVERLGPVTVQQSWHDATGFHMVVLDESGVARSKSPWSVLVSATQHGITPVAASAGSSIPATVMGIGSLVIGDDFIIDHGHAADAADASQAAATPAEAAYLLAIPKGGS
jgi:hypothetical protein